MYQTQNNAYILGVEKSCDCEGVYIGLLSIYNFCFLKLGGRCMDFFFMLCIILFMSEIFHNKENRLKFLTTAFKNPVWFHKYLSDIFQNRLWSAS